MRHIPTPFHSRGARGFGLIEVMIAAFIMLLLGAAITALMKRQGQTISAFRGISTRDALWQRLAAAGGNPKAIRNSKDLAQNAVFRRCLSRPGCPTQAKIGFVLVDPWGTQLAGPDNPSGGQPVRYRIDGTKCSQASPQCPLEAYASAKIDCKPLSNNECQPTTIEIHYVIRQAPNIKIPGQAALADAVGQSPMVRISDLDTQGDVVCTKPNEVLKGITSDGKPLCVNTAQALGIEIVEGTATHRANPNAAAGTNHCGWPNSPRMEHVWGEVECPSGKIPTGGGGECNMGTGGFLETMRLTSGRRWMVDCCKYSPFLPSKIWVYCMNNPNTP